VWRRRFATVALAASLAPLVGVVPVAAAAPVDVAATRAVALPGTLGGPVPTVYGTAQAGSSATGVFAAATPKIKGQVRTGATVRVARGTWTPSASAYKYRWRVDGVAIRGATGLRFTIPSAYKGRQLSVSVRGIRTGYKAKTVTSAATKVARSYTRTSRPKISGTVRVASTLKVSDYGTWKPTPSSWRYRWKANGVAITGATSSSFKLTKAQHGKKITVRVTAVRKGFYRSSRTSAATTTVAWPVGVSKPRITSNPVQTRVASGDSASFTVGASGGRLRYQWQVSADGATWTNLDGVTSSTVTLTPRIAHDGYRFRAAVWNVAGKVYSKPARLWVDSSRSEPYEVGDPLELWNWRGVMGVTSETRTSTTSLVSAPIKMCYHGVGSAYPSVDLSVEYVGSNGVAYDEGSQTFDDDIWKTSELTSGGCTVFTAYAILPSNVVSGGTWRTSDVSSAPTYRQWVQGR
jgi:hypothetical protein